MPQSARLATMIERTHEMKPLAEMNEIELKAEIDQRRAARRQKEDARLRALRDELGILRALDAQDP